MIGSRIRLAREVFGITQSDLAALIGTTQSGVASIEAGIYRPSQQFLQTIAMKTGFDPSFFEKGDLPEFPVGSLLYRATVSVKPSVRMKAHGLAQIGYELADSLATKWKKIPVGIPRVTGEEPATCAQLSRDALGLSPNSPIKNLLLLLERTGVLVLPIPVENDGFDGFSAWTSTARPIIALIEGKRGYRRVFTASEELGHLVMHSPLRVSPKEADIEARAFAQEFLLPREAMESEMTRPITLSGISLLKPRWGGSIKFLVKRAQSLGFLNPNQYRYLNQQMAAKWGSHEPGDEDVVQETPRMLRKLAEMSYGNPVNIGKLAKDSGLSPGMLRAFLGIEDASKKILEFKPN
jgi:Zn-dependent peptidase ImmA (M78 family)/transcriptional regulator with XRE-family HTH domain